MKDGCCSRSWGLRFNSSCKISSWSSGKPKFLNNSGRPSPEGLCEDTSLLQMSPPVRGGSCPGVTGPPGAVPAESSLLVSAPPPGSAWDEPFPSLGAPHDEQDLAAASALCTPQGQGNECMWPGHEAFLPVQCHSNGIYR